ncbi:T9SS type A sorting domain-containing protein [Haliscomenobacter hydrossis]|uniref:Secretion system C-terminal sorting domain-containing protein n=1 Tax=Haliscomenobacter hydrossis (strain ATCC 27775 / DSM 1100 / LMG 10767 / O) TaxID=760192 RepID=F4L7I4_HALH1|nr:T9SS type A sorting domain-containing protein [Haliscomenobacter hydrossis]AEE54164.1 hypothetical protein Halhy_6345 [Haliscomenobacter hydrossis DSM 1100]
MSTRLMFKACLWLLVSLFALGKLRAQNDCNCKAWPTLQIEAKCRYILRKDQLDLKNCPDSYIVVHDNNAKNLDTIDAPGLFDYSLYSKDGKLICIGKVSAEGAYGPQLDSVNFQLDTLPFMDVNLIDNQTIGRPGTEASPPFGQLRFTSDGKIVDGDFKLDKTPNLGLAYFSMGCHATTPCGILVDVGTDLIFPTCQEALQKNLYVTIRRTWFSQACQFNPRAFTSQYIAIRRPKIQDFHWNIPIVKNREATFYYGQCTLDPGLIPTNELFPVIGKDNIKMNAGVPGLNLSYAVNDQIDTVCNKTGLKISRTYLIYDECKDKVVDTFKINFIPGQATQIWITSSSDAIIIDLPREPCKIPVSNQIDSILKFLRLKINVSCPFNYMDWKIEYLPESKSNPPLYNSTFTSPQAVSVVDGKFAIYAGSYRISFIAIDSCQNLYTKTFDFSAREPGTLDVVCQAPFEVRLTNNPFYGKYFKGENLYGRAERHPCAIYRYVRRVVSPECLPNHLANLDYDIDRDGNVLEHFEYIRTGPFAGQYYTPWGYYLEAFGCDYGKSVHYESWVVTGTGKGGLCSSYFNVTDQNSAPQARIEVAQTVTKLGKSTCVPVKVSGFTSMVGVQFAVKFDQNILKLDSVRVPNDFSRRILFGYPGAGLNPKDRLALSWVYDGTNAVTLPSASTFMELCFSPLSVGTSKVWVDTLSAIELVNKNEAIFTARTQPGEVSVVLKPEFNIPTNQIDAPPPLNAATIGNRIIPPIRVFPNPSTDKINIALTDQFLPEGKLILKDLQGRILKQQLITTHLTQMNVSDVSPGIVLLEFYSQNQVWTERIVVLKP